MALPLFLLLASLCGSDTEHLIVMETLLPKGSILDVLNEDKSLISRVFIESERIPFSMYAEFCIITFDSI